MKRYEKLYMGVVAMCVVFVFFGGNINDSFVSDDYDWLFIAQQGAPLIESFVGNYYGEHGVGGTFRPMVNVFFEITTRLFGMNPVPYHVVLLVVHALNALLVGILAVVLLQGRVYARTVSWMSMILFAIVPAHTEAVVWIAAIGDPLALFLYLSAFLFFTRYRRDKGASLRYAVVSYVLLVCSLLTKEIALTFPFVILSYEYLILHNRSLKSLVRSVTPFVFIVGAYLMYRYWAIGVGAGYYAQESLVIDWGRYLYNFISFDVGTFFFGDTRRMITNFLFTVWPLYLAILIAVIVYCVKSVMRGELRTVSFLSLYWLCNITLVVPLGMSVVHNEGVRYMYTAFVGVIILVAWGIGYVYSIKKWVGMSLFLLVGVYFGSVLVSELRIWSTASTLAQDIVSQAHTFSYDEYAKVYIVGLPEVYEGAPVLRNGIVQALQLKGNEIEVERIPAYLMLRSDDVGYPIYEGYEVLPDGVHFTTQNQRYVVSGNATEIFPEYKTELWNYDYEKGVADTLRVQFRNGREFDWARKDIALLYWDGVTLRQVSY